MMESRKMWPVLVSMRRENGCTLGERTTQWESGTSGQSLPPPPHTHITLLTDIHVDIENKQISGNAYSYIFLVDAYILIIFLEQGVCNAKEYSKLMPL